jgi:hypothetical protein
MEKERQHDGRMLDDLNKLVEHHEQLHRSQMARDSDSKPNAPIHLTPGRMALGQSHDPGVTTPRAEKA